MGGMVGEASWIMDDTTHLPLLWRQRNEEEEEDEINLLTLIEHH